MAIYGDGKHNENMEYREYISIEDTEYASTKWYAGVYDSGDVEYEFALIIGTDEYGNTTNEIRWTGIEEPEGNLEEIESKIWKKWEQR